MSDSQTQNEKKSRETSEVYDSVFVFLMDFADKAETIVPQPKSRAVINVEEEEEEEGEPLENVGDGNAGEVFHKLPMRNKEEMLKDVLDEIVGNMLKKLPEDGKEAFLVRCFDGLLLKLPGKLRRAIETKANDVFSQSQVAFTTLSAPESPSAFENQFPADDLQPVGFSVKFPPSIGGKGRGGKGGGRGGGRR